MNNFKHTANATPLTDTRTLKATLIAAGISVLFSSATLADDNMTAFTAAAAKYSQKTSVGFMSQVMNAVSNGEARDLIVIFDDNKVGSGQYHADA